MKFYLFLLKLYFNSIGLLFPRNSIKRLDRLFSTPRGTVIRSKETAVLKNAKQAYLKTQDYNLAIYEWGVGNNFVLLCHGWESNAGSLGAMVEPLLQRGYRVIAFDGPAHGKSSGKQASLLKFKDALVSIIQAYGTPDIIIGHSLGAMAIMLANSETNIPIRKSVLFAPINQVSVVFEEFKNMISIPDKLYQKFIKRLESKSGYLLTNLVFENIALKTALKEVLVLHDSKDQITPIRHSQEITKNWDESQLAIIEGSGHYKILWNDNALDEVFQFID